MSQRRNASAIAARPDRQRQRDKAVRPAVLVTWTQVFPLSSGPAQRIRRQIGGMSASAVAEATKAYVGEIDAHLPAGLSTDVHGSVIGLSDFAGDARSALFAAVFATDLDAILRTFET